MRPQALRASAARLTPDLFNNFFAMNRDVVRRFSADPHLVTFHAEYHHGYIGADGSPPPRHWASLIGLPTRIEKIFRYHDSATTDLTVSQEKQRKRYCANDVL